MLSQSSYSRTMCTTKNYARTTPNQLLKSISFWWTGHNVKHYTISLKVQNISKITETFELLDLRKVVWSANVWSSDGCHLSSNSQRNDIPNSKLCSINWECHRFSCNVWILFINLCVCKSYYRHRSRWGIQISTSLHISNSDLNKIVRIL